MIIKDFCQDIRSATQDLISNLRGVRALETAEKSNVLGGHLDVALEASGYADSEAGMRSLLFGSMASNLTARSARRGGFGGGDTGDGDTGDDDTGETTNAELLAKLALSEATKKALETAVELLLKKLRGDIDWKPPPGGVTLAPAVAAAKAAQCFSDLAVQRRMCHCE